MLKDVKFIYFGSPKFARDILKRLVESGVVPWAVVCNPDKPFGRKKIITPPLVKQYITENKLFVKIFQPDSKEELSALLLNKNFQEAKFGIVAAYAKIIPQEVIDSFPLGVIGVHPSLLPLFRGSSPIQSALLNGEQETGTTLYLMDAKMDHGAIIDQERMNISDFSWNYLKLEEALANSSANALIRNLPLFVEGKITPKPQDDTLATLTSKFVTQDGFVNLKTDNSIIIARKIRALNPDPGVYAEINGKRVKLLEVSQKEDGNIAITKIQPEGKNPQPAALKLPLL